MSKNIVLIRFEYGQLRIFKDFHGFTSTNVENGKFQTTIKPSTSIFCKCQLMYSYAEFDVDSDFATKQ